jgi:hypothetical protein
MGPTLGGSGWYESVIGPWAPEHDDSGMTNRLLGAALWFGTIWFGYEILWSVTDAPRLFGPVIATAVVFLVERTSDRPIWSLIRR